MSPAAWCKTLMSSSAVNVSGNAWASRLNSRNAVGSLMRMLSVSSAKLFLRLGNTSKYVVTSLGIIWPSSEDIARISTNLEGNR